MYLFPNRLIAVSTSTLSPLKIPDPRVCRFESGSGHHVVGSARVGEGVDFCGEDKVVLVQAADLVGLQRELGIAPAEADVGMMPFVLGNHPHTIEFSDVALPKAV